MIIKTKLTLEMKALLKDVAKTAILHNSNVGISAPALLILLEENEQYEGVIKKAKEWVAMENKDGTHLFEEFIAALKGVSL